jgi:hypothetical protein
MSLNCQRPKACHARYYYTDRFSVRVQTTRESTTHAMQCPKRLAMTVAREMKMIDAVENMP